MAPRTGRPHGPAAERGRPARDRDSRLVARAQRGDGDARRRLVENHMGLVRSLAWRYRDLGLPLEDLVQEGAIGVLEAIDRFDALKGASFSTYAYWRARRTMTHALTDHGRLLRLPKSVVERRRALADATAALVNAGRSPTVDALAEVTQLRVSDVVAALEAPAEIASLDAQFADGATIEGSLADPAATDPPAEAVDQVECAALREAIGHLTARQLAVIDGRFGLSGAPRTLTEIAGDLHLSPARVRAIESHAIHDLAIELEDALTGS
jgi:RNA polymerase primary sigma factor